MSNQARLPARVRPYAALYNRFNRWSRQGLCLQMFEAPTGHSGIFDGAAIDATHVKAHWRRRGDLQPSHRSLPAAGGPSCMAKRYRPLYRAQTRAGSLT